MHDALYEAVKQLDVFDTHSHLIGGSLAAADFWQIGEYFWFLRELKAAGYPANAEQLSEPERVAAYAKAFQATRNTAMNWVVRRIFTDLYGIELAGEESFYRAIAAVNESKSRPGWAKHVAQKLQITKITVNREEHVDFGELPGTAVLVPRIDGQLNTWLRQILQAQDQAAAAESAVEEIRALAGQYSQRGCRGIMTTLPRLNIPTYQNGTSLQKAGNSRDQVLAYLLHQICAAVTENSLFLQLFLGMENGYSSVVTAVNDPLRIVNLHGLFEQYPCRFQLVLASEINNLDVVHAARIFPNVYVGGLWWFNFRISTYHECMQRRIEALPSSKSALVASDSRCIEWCYGKILLVKKVLADFLAAQIAQGWIDLNEAVRVASDWLSGSFAHLLR